MDEVLMGSGGVVRESRVGVVGELRQVAGQRRCE